MCERRQFNDNSNGANQTSLPGLPAGLPELEQHFDRHQVPPAGREYVVQAVTGDPARRLASRGGNIVVRFASRKMDAIIQAASRTTHLPFVETCEYDPGTILFVCQPGDLYLTIVDARDRRRRIRHAPDYLVLDAEGFSLVQCRREKALQRDARQAQSAVRQGRIHLAVAGRGGRGAGTRPRVPGFLVRRGQDDLAEKLALPIRLLKC